MAFPDSSRESTDRWVSEQIHTDVHPCLQVLGGIYRDAREDVEGRRDQKESAVDKYYRRVWRKSWNDGILVA